MEVFKHLEGLLVTLYISRLNTGQALTEIRNELVESESYHKPITATESLTFERFTDWNVLSCKTNRMA